MRDVTGDTHDDGHTVLLGGSHGGRGRRWKWNSCTVHKYLSLCRI